MVAATWVLAILGGLTLIGGAVKLGMDLASVKKQISPNGGDSDSLGDVAVQIKNLLADHLEQDSEKTERYARVLMEGQRELLSAVKAADTAARDK